MTPNIIVKNGILEFASVTGQVARNLIVNYEDKKFFNILTTRIFKIVNTSKKYNNALTYMPQ